ncbi:MAG: hypothetical protein K0R03_2400 [Moraxellaceae bacterium]|nr:hypothetical protein [Moraxellaceae bacterium]
MSFLSALEALSSECLATSQGFIALKSASEAMIAP